MVYDSTCVEIKSPGNAISDWLKSNRVDLIGCQTIQGGVNFKLLGDPPNCRVGGEVTFDTVQSSEVTRLVRSPYAFPGDKPRLPSLHINGMPLDEEHFSKAHFFLFRTHDGDAGVMDVLGVSDNPRGVKIRYKLIAQPADELAVLRPKLTSGEIDVRREAMTAIYSMPSPSINLVPDLVRIMKQDFDGIMRSLATDTLGHIGTNAGLKRRQHCRPL